MRINFTPKVAYRMIDRAKRTFCRYPCRTVAQEWKNLLKSLQVFIVINPKLLTTAGTACFVRVRDARTLFKIPREYEPTKVDGVLGYFIIEVNPKLVILDPPSEVYDTISHELAHCLDYKIRGFYGRTDAEVHDEFWSFLHKRMGGDGEQFISHEKSKFRLKMAAKKAQRLTKSFKPLDFTRKRL